MTLSEHGEQERQLRRVSARIATVVLAFCRERLADAPIFYAGDLRDYVAEHVGGAPASPDRILRDLRRRGRVRYVVTDRSRSEYRIDAVRPDEVPDEPSPEFDAHDQGRLL